MNGLLLAFLLTVVPGQTDTIRTPAVALSVRQRILPAQLPASSTEVRAAELESAGILSPKQLSSLVPGLHMPVYGASMTSTIYMRGFGSRMENPVIGLYVDDIPILDKNVYDFDFLDLRSATMLRGPQGTLFGRNAMCGALLLHTLSPGAYEGMRVRVEGGSAATLRGSFSLYRARDAVSVGFRRSDGFFKNTWTGRMCDPYAGIQGRWKHVFSLPEGWRGSNLLSASYVDEGAFAYAPYKDGAVGPVAYNDEGSYRRATLLEGLKLSRAGERVTAECMGSLQVLLDDMKMDQDYSPASVFTLRQRQRSGALTLEAVFRPAETPENWERTTGVFGFVRFNAMHAPVLFKEDGIRDLILAGANGNIPPEIGSLDIPADPFTVHSDFGILTGNAAAYHESVFHCGRFHFTAGLRIDFSAGSMRYDSRAELSYRFLPTMLSYKTFQTVFQGVIGHAGLEVLPKASVRFDAFGAESESGSLMLYATFAKGYRDGGFNTQIFSDILQNRLMNGLMADLGVYFDTPAVSVGASNTEYRPEQAYNFELGARWRLGEHLSGLLDGYWILGRDPQITVFPPGKSTGRMMTNAGRSRSVGIDCEAVWTSERLSLRAAYGWNDARFTRFHDGHADYSGKRAPYVPSQTAWLGGEYVFPCTRGRLEAVRIAVDCRGEGPVMWDEANTLRQAFHVVPGGRITVSFPKLDVYVRGENLSGSSYRTFYFKSVGNAFFQMARPAQLYVGMIITDL